MTTERPASCGNCVFWRVWDKERAFGNCHVKPPRVENVEGIWDTVFPATERAHVCGSHWFAESWRAVKRAELEKAVEANQRSVEIAREKYMETRNGQTLTAEGRAI